MPLQVCACVCVFALATAHVGLALREDFAHILTPVKCVSMRWGASLLVPAPCCEMVTNALPSNTAWMCAQRPSLHFCFFLVPAASFSLLFLRFLFLWLGRGRLQPRSEVGQNRCAGAGAGADCSDCLSTFVSPAANLARRANSLFYCSLRE